MINNHEHTKNKDGKTLNREHCQIKYIKIN